MCSKHTVVYCIYILQSCIKYSKHNFTNTTFHLVHGEFMQSKLRDGVVQNNMQAVKNGLQVPIA